MVNENELMGGLQAAMQSAGPAGSTLFYGMDPAQQAYFQQQATLNGTPVAQPSWVTARDPSLNKFVMFPNVTVGGQVMAESSPFSGGMGGEAMDSSYFEGGVPGGQYLGMNEAIQPMYYLGQRFGQDVTDAISLPTLLSGNPHRVVNTTTGEVLYQGADPQGVVSALDQLTQGGNKNEWIIQQALGDQWSEVAKQEKMENVFTDKFLPMALAVAGGAALGPALGGLSAAGKAGILGASKLAGAAGAGLGAGIGSTTGHLIAGKPLDDALKAGAITAITAGATKGLLGGAEGKTAALTGKGAGVASGGLEGYTPFDPSSITAADLGLGQLANIPGALPVDAITGGALGGVPADAITVVADRIGGGLGNLASGAISGGVGGIGSDLVSLANAYDMRPPQQIQEARPDEEITVTSTGTQAPNIGANIAAGATGALPSTAPKPLPGDDPIINVTSKPTPDMTLDEVLGAGGGATLAELAQQAMESGQSPSQRATEAAKEAPAEQKKGMSTLGKVTGGLALLDALTKLLGGGGGGGSRGPTGLDSLSPVFSAQLPTPGGQFSPQALTQRMPGADTRPAIDYERYGYGPARSFFNYVPETAAERQAFTAAAAPTPRTGVGTLMPGALPGAQPQTGGGINPMLQAGFEQLRAAMPGADDGQLIAFLGTPEGQQKLVEIFEGLGAQPRARGGSMGGEGDSRDSFAVRGPGDGRSDDIPALLSDGEYVIDAETVALLGDGSSKAGAERLDLFRSNVRKHKGRDLAEGKFSVNAKPPERYLSGGRV